MHSWLVIMGFLNFLQITYFRSENIQECGHNVYPISDFYKCDSDNDHFEEFNINLTELESSLIRNQTDLVVTYHNAGGDLIDFSPGTQFVVNQRTIIVRVTNYRWMLQRNLF